MAFSKHSIRLSAAMIVVLGWCFCGTVALAQTDAATLYRQIQDKYMNAATVKVWFADSDRPQIQGTLLVKKASKYILHLGAYSIYCDGETVWTFQPARNTVLINRYLSRRNALSPEQVFLAFPATYIPTLARATVSTGEKFQVLTLKPRSHEEMVAGLERIVLRLMPGTLDLVELEVSDGSSTRRLAISRIQTDIEVADEEFAFAVPEEVRIIDMR